MGSLPDLAEADTAQPTQDLGLPPVDAQLPQCAPTLPTCTTGVTPFLVCDYNGQEVKDRCHRVCVQCSTARDCQFEYGGWVLVCVGSCNPLGCP